MHNRESHCQHEEHECEIEALVVKTHGKRFVH
jgi:hypothetical protein